MARPVADQAPAREPADLRELEARLDRAERRLERALGAMNGIVYDWDITTNRVERAGALELLLGSGAAEMAAQPDAWAERVHPEDLDRFWSTLLAALEDLQPFELEYRIRHADGSWVLLWERSVVECGPDGRASHVYGVAIDIGQRHRMETALADSENRFQAILDAEPQCVMVLDRDGVLRHINPAGLAMVEAESVASILGLPAEELLQPPHRAAFRRLHRDILAGETGTLEFEVCGFRGGSRWMSCTAAPLRDSAGRIVGGIAVCGDITERRKRDERMRVQAEILETMTEGVALTDSRGILRYTNRALDDMFGYAPGELAGTSAWQLAAGSRPFLRRALRSALRGAGSRIEFDGVRRDRRRFRGALTLTRLDIAGERHWIGVLQDVTERKALEQELLAIASREQARIGHDLHDGLGQDLTAVALFLEGLRSRLEREAPAAVAEVAAVMEQVNRAIESTRTIARGLSPIVVGQGGLPEALRGLAERSAGLYGIPVRLRIGPWPEREPEQAVVLQLYRIAQEALTNVARHARATRAWVLLRVRAGQILLRIADDGRGPPEEAASALGLGLRIMRYRAAMIGGEFQLGRRPRGGTSIQVVCPLDAAGTGQA